MPNSNDSLLNNLSNVASMKILIIRFSSIGDIVLTTPVIRCLKKTAGLHAEVHYVTKKAYAGIVQNNPYVDMVHVYDDDFGQLAKSLRAEQFDFIADLHNSIRSWRLRLSLKKPSKQFPKLNIQKWLLTAFKINKMPDLHIVDRYFETVRHLGTKNDTEGLDFFIPAAEEGFADVIPETFRKNYIAFVIGARHATKRLPAGKIADVCKMLSVPVVLLGDHEDRQQGDLVYRACQENVFNACGLISLNQAAFLVKSARLVISHDTGLMHIAAAFKKRIISIWGNTVPEFGMSPYMPGHEKRSAIIDVKGLSCRPCSKIGYEKCPKGHFDCMQKIDTGLVVRQARTYLDEQAGA